MSTSSSQTPEIGFRKEKHLSICTDPARFSVEGGAPRFDAVRFIHHALPEIDERSVDPGVEFLGRRLPYPIFISCMTGGSDKGFLANRELARAAQTTGLPVGMGSIRILFDHPELAPHFRLKELAPEVPVLANIGGVQVRDENHARLFEWVKRLEVDALVVHLNPGQELFQPEGDREFRGIRDAIGRLCDGSPVPVIVKETGFGIRPTEVRELLRLGVAFVDVAGAGGTNWVTVEAYRLPEAERGPAEELRDWGLPTVLLLAALDGAAAGEDGESRVLASGGVRSGLDVAKAVALGARLAGLALPLIRDVVAGGAEAVVRRIEGLETVVRAVMVLTGSRTLADLRTGKLWLDPAFKAEIEAFRAAESAST
ncbi:MAG: type 2 isopentenyl-diphosphate Delta-isomerase [Spirochaetales bacterium]|nr:type 2 isopentenyl-diphosphate Delta-isomerase [Spirochaetales bacterium]